MLLSKLVRANLDDRGGALIGVIALLGITSVIAVTVGTVSVNSLQTTNAVAASVEARGAADAGINAAELALRSSSGCPASGVLTRTAAPAYNVRIQHDLGSGWVNGCPPPQATRVRFLSEGLAARGTFATVTSGSKLTIEAVYQYIPQYVVIPDIDPAVYAYSVDGVLKKFVLDSADLSIAADVQIKKGDFICSNNAFVRGDVILGDGSADLTSCTIRGTLHATGSVAIDGSSFVQNDVIAGGTGLGASALALRLDSGADVSGSLFAGGNVSIDNNGTTVGGNVTAARNTSTNLTVGSGATVTGNVLTSGTLTRVGTITGSTSTAVVGLEVPPTPLVPEWTDIPWTPITEAQLPSTTWGQQGFTNLEIWTGSCSFSGGDSRWAALDDYTEKTVVDATACTGGVVTSSSLAPALALQSDIAIIADSFSMDKLYMSSSDVTQNRKLYLVVPDNNANFQPSCEGGAGDIYMNSENNISATLSAFLYSPCEIKSDRNGLRGQMYGGVVDFDQQAQMTYVPTTPPGIDLSANLPVVRELVGALLGERLSIREVSSGG